MKTVNKKHTRIGAGLLTLALITLINPNINVFDFLPDFIGFFILAKFFERASVSVPYFEEARVDFLRLAYVSIAKIPAFILITFVRGQNTLDNDILCLASVSFAAIEIILTVKAARNIFKALFYLGQRSDASALISYSPYFKRGVIRSVALSALTLGVYNIYWLYKTVKAQRALKGYTRGGALELLCLLFVPFYFLYWWYSRGEATKAELEACRSEYKLGGVVFLLASIPFGGVISLALMQRALNIIPEERFAREKKQAEELRSLTVIFFVVKALAYALPTFVLLTRTENVSGIPTLVTGSNLYPYALILSLLLAGAAGLVWILHMRAYVVAVKLEGKFHEGVLALQSSDDEVTLKEKVTKRRLFRVFGAFTVASALTLELTLNNLEEINIIPHFLFGIVFTAALFMLSGVMKMKVFERAIALVAGGGYILISIIFYILQTNFLAVYDYYELYFPTPGPGTLYTFVCVAAFFELCAYGLLMALFAVFMIRFVKGRLGITVTDSRYSLQDRDYHRSFIIKTLIAAVIGFAAGLTKFISVMLHFNVKFIISDSSDSVTSPVVSSGIPWFGVVVGAAAIGYFLYTLYYFSTIKDELNGK